MLVGFGSFEVVRRAEKKGKKSKVRRAIKN
jgi:nucleoid DNA-binding protein